MTKAKPKDDGTGDGRRDADPWAGVAVTLSGPVLASIPGPALLVSAAGAVRAANARGQALAEAIIKGEHRPLVALVEAVARTGRPGREIARQPVPQGTLVLELTAVPTADADTVLLIGRDVTLETNLRSALVDSRQRYKTLVDISSDFAWEVGAEGTFSFVSPKGALGYSAEFLVGKDPRAFIAEAAPEETEGDPFHALHPMDSVRLWLKAASGEPTCVVVTAAPNTDAEGNWTGARGVCRDVTAEHEREVALARARNRERMLTAIVHAFRDEVDPTDMLDHAAQALAQGLGADGCQLFRAPQDVTGHPRPDAMQLTAAHGEAGSMDAARGLLPSIGASGGLVEVVHGGWQVLATATRHKGEPNGAILLWRHGHRIPWSDDDRILIGDLGAQVGLVNEQAAAHERMIRLSRTDPLTGLFNRRAFFQELKRRFERAEAGGIKSALVYVDLDNFKQVNDIHGHKAGDLVLLEVKDNLLHHSRPTDLVARLGGDEFALWMEGADGDTAIRRVREILDTGARLARFSGHPDAPLHFSIGVAMHDPDWGEDRDALIHRADVAMYEAKRGGKANMAVAPPPTANTGDGE